MRRRSLPRPDDKPIQHWSPSHDQVVMYHLYGMSNVEIGATVGYSRWHVEKILRDPRAQNAKEVLRKRILGGAMAQIEERMGALGIQSIKNIAKTIEDTTAELGTRAKKHQDDVSFELLSRIGFGRKGPESEAGGIHLPKEEAQQLVAAIEKANTAREIIASAEEVPYSEESDSNGSGLDGSNGREGSE